MNAQQLLKADLLDILFEGKNKNYGAYTLRKGYYKRLYLALGISMLLTVLVSATLIFWPKKAVNNSNSLYIDVKLDGKPKADQPKEKIKPIVAKSKQAVKSVKVFVPKITPDNLVTLPSQINDVKAPIGRVDVPDGVDNGTPPLPPSPPNNGGDGGTLPPEIIKPEPKIINKPVDLTLNSAKPISWNKYLQTALQPYVNKATYDGCEAGSYVITVRFLVDELGNPSEATIVSEGNNCNLGNYAMAVLLKGPKWSINRLADGTVTKSIQQTTFRIEIGEG